MLRKFLHRLSVLVLCSALILFTLMQVLEFEVLGPVRRVVRAAAKAIFGI